MSEKIYVGKLSQRVNKFGDNEIKIGYTKEHLQALLDNVSESGWVNVVQKLGKNGEPYQQIDTWKPSNTAPATVEQDSLPF
jgi:hypothetical protein